MSYEKEVLINCITEDEFSKGFDIYINGIKVNENLKFYDTNFKVNLSCQKREVNIKFIQKHFLCKNLWFFQSFIILLLSIFAGYYDNFSIKGPFVAMAEGRLKIADNAQLMVRLKKIKSTNIIVYSFDIQPQNNCSYISLCNKTISTSKLKQRFIISALFPLSVIFSFVVFIFYTMGKKFIDIQMNIGGCILKVLCLLLIIVYIVIAKNIFSASNIHKE